MPELLTNQFGRAEQKEALKQPFDLEAFLGKRHAETLQVETNDGELETVYVFEHSQTLPSRLPEGYAYIGGLARNVLLQELGEPVFPFRDIDLAGIIEFGPDVSLAPSLNQEFMVDDIKHGHGLRVQSIHGYFRSRDFTINELFIMGDKVYASEACLLDMADKLIRPTHYEVDKEKDDNGSESTWGIHPKLVMKSLRLYLEFKLMYGEAKLDGLERWSWDFEKLPLFWVAYGLNRAYQSGDQIAIAFYKFLVRQGYREPAIASKSWSKKLKNMAISIRFQMIENDQTPFEFENPDWNQAAWNYVLEAEDADEDADELYYEELAQDYSAKIKNLPRRTHQKF